MADVIFKRGTKAEIDAEPNSDGKILFTTDQIYNKIYTDNGTKRIQIGGTMDVDTTLSTTSSNPIANSTVTAEFNKINTDLSAQSKVVSKIDLATLSNISIYHDLINGEEIMGLIITSTSGTRLLLQIGSNSSIGFFAYNSTSKSWDQYWKK